MFASETDLDNLRKLQKTDGEVIRLEKELASLPQRKAILEVRKNLSDIVEKKVKVQDMLDVAEEQFDALAKEDETLTKKQQEVEAKLKEVQGDYRSVNAFTKDLNGVAKRREKVSVKLQGVEDQLNKINPVMKQIMTACRAYEAKEKELITSFQKQGGELQSRIAQGKKASAALEAEIPAELLKEYKIKQASCGAIALAVLENNSCSACRAKFDTGKLSRIKKDAPVSSCPSCRRMLIVE